MMGFFMFTEIINKIELNQLGEETCSYKFQESCYSKLDFLLSKRIFNESGKVVYSLVITYNDQDDIETQTEYDYLADTMENIVSFYAENGVPEKTVSTFNDVSKIIRSWKLNDLGNVDQCIHKDENDNLILKEVYTLDDFGNTIQSLEYDEFGTVSCEVKSTFYVDKTLATESIKTKGEKEVIKYSSQGHVISREFFNAKKAKIAHETYSYEQGNLVKMEMQNPGEKYVSIINNVYDEQNNIILNTAYQNGKLTFRNEASYSSSKRIVKQHLTEFSYYDKIELNEILLHTYQDS
jgi:hypothetical protein